MTELCLGGHDLCDVFVFSDREYPRLGQMIVDYENPLKKMMEEFVPHGKVIFACYNEIRKSYYSVSQLIKTTWFNLSSFVFRLSFSLYDSRCQMHWSPCRWSTHAGICLQISGGTLSSSVWLVLLAPCSTRLNPTRSGFAIVFNYFCELGLCRHTQLSFKAA